MEAHIELTPCLTVKGIEPTRGIMALQDNDILAGKCETDARSEASHTGADDDGFVMVADRGSLASESVMEWRAVSCHYRDGIIDDTAIHIKRNTDKLPVLRW